MILGYKTEVDKGEGILKALPTIMFRSQQRKLFKLIHVRIYYMTVKITKGSEYVLFTVSLNAYT